MSGAPGGLEITIRQQADATALELRGELLADLGERYGAGEVGARPGPDDIVASLVARAGDGTPLGIAALRPFEPGTLEVKRMYVRPQARRRGVALALLTALEAEARRLGARRIVLETGTAQPEAIALYERHGYTPIPRYPPYADDARSRCYERALD